MPLGIARVNLTVATGSIASVSTPGGRGQFVVVGPSSAGEIETPTPITPGSSALASFGNGPAVEAAAYALGYEVDRLLFVRTDPDGGTEGEYGTLGDDIAGSIEIEADETVLPEDDLEVIVQFTTGGTLGTAGIKYKYSLDGGRKFSGTIALGTATSITLPYGAGKFNVAASAAEIVALTADLRTQFLAHAVYTTDDVHGAADPTEYDITTPTDLATSITALGELITGMAIHVALTDDDVHGAADTVAAAALAALTAPTDGPEAAASANALKAIFAAHIALITDDVHGAADTENVVTAANATYGAIIAGDAFDCTTTAPRWSIDSLIAALTVLKNMALSGQRFGTISIIGPFETAGELEAVHAEMLDMRTKIKYRRVFTHFRARDQGETAVAYSEAFEELVGTVAADTIAITPSWYCPSKINPGAVYVRPYSFHAAARTSKLREDISANSRTEFGSGTGQIRDSSGAVLPRAVDEYDQELWTPLRGFAPRTWPDKSASQIFAGFGATLAADGEDTAALRVAQVLDLAAETAYPPLADVCGRGLVPAPDNTLDVNQKKRIEATLGMILTNALVKTGKAVGARFAIDPGQSIVGTPPIVITGQALIRVKGYVDEFHVTVSVDATPVAVAA
jgi:hypothetical protein